MSTRPELTWAVRPDGTVLPVPAGGGGASIHQTDFRGRNDDGSETAATWQAATNTNWDQVADQNFRVRLAVEQRNMDNTVTAQLQYRHNGGTWTNVTDTTSVVRATSSTHYTNGDDATQQITTGTYTGGETASGQGLMPHSQTILTDEWAEFEWCVEIISTDVAGGDTIEFRCTNNGTVFDTYDQIAQCSAVLLTAPTNFQVVQATASAAVDLTWDDNDGSPYILQRETWDPDAGTWGNLLEVNGISQTSYTDTATDPVLHRYRVAVERDGVAASDWTAWVEIDVSEFGGTIPVVGGATFTAMPAETATLGSATVESTSTVTAAGTVVPHHAGSLTAVSSSKASAAGTLLNLGSITATSTSEQVASGHSQGEAIGSATMGSTSAVSAGGHVIRSASTSVQSGSEFVADGRLATIHGIATTESTTAFTADGRSITVSGSATVVSTSELVATAALTEKIMGSATLVSTSELAVSGRVDITVASVLPFVPVPSTRKRSQRAAF